ncbi:MAG: four helix bundle protein [Elusimicrobiota bacterium]
MSTYADFVFDFEKMEVYKISMEFVKEAFKVYKSLPREFKYSIGDQFVRASLSVVNNIAEGSGKTSKKWKATYYNTALDSARECVPMITLLLSEEMILRENHWNLRSKCIHICNMMGRLIKSLNLEKVSSLS